MFMIYMILFVAGSNVYTHHSIIYSRIVDVKGVQKMRTFLKKNARLVLIVKKVFHILLEPL